MKYFSSLKKQGIFISGLRGGSGKTIFTIGFIATLKYFGFSVSPFKKGPDYIDAGWLSLAAGNTCRNLDTFLVNSSDIIDTYNKYSKDSNISVIEGNRGIYDSIDTLGESSSAELSRLLKLPVLLCVDVTKSTRTIAAIISGILKFDSTINFAGIILNNVAGERHRDILIKSIKKYCNITVIGAIPKLTKNFFPERHMGLVPTSDHNLSKESIRYTRLIIQKYVDFNKILKICKIDNNIIKKNKMQIDISKLYNKKKLDIVKNNYFFNKKELTINTKKPTIGIAADPAFQFYYPENIEALKKTGFSVVFVSPIKSKYIPKIDGLYIGGGFPEIHAKKLENNIFFKHKLKELAEKGMPIYAECGGLIYLGKEIIIKNKSFKMSNILPITFKIFSRPQAHGYTIIKIKNKNPFYPIGTKIMGHEFHYSKVENWKGNNNQLTFSMERGIGFLKKKDGIIYKNVLGTYTHIHASGTKKWAKYFILKVKKYIKTKK